MALFVGSSLIAPHAISAKTTAGLQRKILIEQSKSGYEWKFIGFYYDPEKKEHVGWYYMVSDINKIIEEKINGTSKE